MKKIRRELIEHQEVLKNFELIEKNILKISKIIQSTFKKNGIIYVAGNGGSATDSQHFVAELLGRYKKRKPYGAVSLSSDIGTITCIANDFGYQNIFSRQLEALGKSKDLLIAFSTSGNSKNIINLLKTSKKKKFFQYVCWEIKVDNQKSFVTILLLLTQRQLLGFKKCIKSYTTMCAI